MTTSLSQSSAVPTSRQMLNKVPEVTLYFWLIKVLCTTVGETAADYLATNLGWGATNTMILTGSILTCLLVTQFSLKRYVPAVYWAAVVVISVLGTQITDQLVNSAGVPLTTTTPLFAVILAAVFAAWYRSERTLSIHSITTTRREAFYWLAILFTFALGTAAGDLVAERFSLGYALSVGVFSAAIALVTVAHFRLRLGPILAFWLAYILTRPLGASVGDLMSQKDPQFGGLGLGTTTTSYIFLGLILAMVAYLTVSKRDLSERGPRPRRAGDHRRPEFRPGRAEPAGQEG